MCFHSCAPLLATTLCSSSYPDCVHRSVRTERHVCMCLSPSTDLMHSDSVTTHRGLETGEEKPRTHTNSHTLTRRNMTVTAGDALQLISAFSRWLLSVKVDLPGDAVKDQNSVVIFSGFLHSIRILHNFFFFPRPWPKKKRTV